MRERRGALSFARLACVLSFSFFYLGALSFSCFDFFVVLFLRFVVLLFRFVVLLFLFRRFVLHILSFCTKGKEESHAALSHLRLKEKPVAKFMAADSSNGLYLNIV